MKIFLLKDVENVGMAEQIVTVSDGFAYNFLIPRKFALEVTPASEGGFTKRIKVGEQRKEVIACKTSMLAERIKVLKPVVKAKVHDNDKLYGAVSEKDIVAVLAELGVRVAARQIIIERKIVTKGLHTVKVKLSNSLQPTFTLKVIAA
jgi:large subunit ribosomal protein L9